MASEEQPWHAAFPAPTMTADIMPQRRAMMILSMKIASMLIIDGFWWNRGMLYELCYKADIEWVVFTCGSSSGRGPRCAGWFLDHVRNTAQDNDMQVMTLEGGVKGWAKAGPQYTQFMDGFRSEYWEKLFAEEEETKQTKADTDANGTGGDPSAAPNAVEAKA
ncbi:hypothetical protein LTR17_022480 [Elasticomyces elasticus]|nr:hypothetical protein LTR17_022480 [Elasticomyces elasticus]